MIIEAKHALYTYTSEVVCVDRYNRINVNFLNFEYSL